MSDAHATGLVDDLRTAGRAVAASPRLSIVAVVTLAVAIGANTAVFAVADSLLFRSLAIPRPDQLMSVSSASAINLGYKSGAGWSVPMWKALQERAGFFGGALAWWPQSFVSSADDWRETTDGAYVSGEFFQTLGIQPIVGRFLTAADDRAGIADVAVVVSHRLWTRSLGGESDLSRVALSVNGLRVNVVGVMPRSFGGLEVGRASDVVLPLHAEPSVRGRDSRLFGSRTFFLFVMIRLKDGQSIDAATKTFRALQPTIVPPESPEFAKEPVVLVPAEGGAVSAGSLQTMYRRPVLAMLVGVALLLFVACANLANLLLARMGMREREIAIRIALGASRWRIWRLLMVESLLLAAAGAVGGLLLASWGAPAIVSLSAVAIDPVLDARVLLFTATATIVTTLLFGMTPAYRASRAMPAQVLKTNSGGAGGGRSRGLAHSLIAVQVALALVVAIGAALFLRTFVELARAPLGFDADSVLVVHADTARSRLDPDQRLGLYQRLVDAVTAVPGVEHAAASMWIPLAGEGASLRLNDPRDVRANESREPNVLVNFVTPGWFRTYGTPLTAGRDFSTGDHASAPKAVIVNDAFVRQFLDGPQAVGQITHQGHLIVGVAADTAYRSIQRAPSMASLALREPAAPTIYAPLAQFGQWNRPGGDTIRVSVRVARGAALAPTTLIVRAISAIDPDLTLTVTPIADLARRTLAQERTSAIVLGVFGLISLSLAMLGLYGLTSHAVRRRHREIAIRLALGETPAAVIAATIGRILIPTTAGIVLGLSVAALLMSWLSSLLFGVASADPLTFAGVAVIVAVAAVLSVLGPALHARRIDPASTLR